MREDEPKGAQANHRAGRFLLYYGWNRLEEAKANSPGQSDEGAAPWVDIRPEWYAMNGQKPHTIKIYWIPVFFTFAYSGRVFKILKINETVLRCIWY